MQRYLAGGSLAGEPLRADLQCHAQVADAVLHPLHRGDGFRFFQFEKPPIFFNQPAYQRAAQSEQAGKLATLQTRYDHAFAQKADAIRGLTSALESRSAPAINAATNAVPKPARRDRDDPWRSEGNAERAPIRKLETNDADYVFISFVLRIICRMA